MFDSILANAKTAGLWLWAKASENKSATALLISCFMLFQIQLFTVLWVITLLVAIVSAIFYFEATDYALDLLKKFGNGLLNAIFTFIGFGLILFVAGFLVNSFNVIAIGVLLVIETCISIFKQVFIACFLEIIRPSPL